jgi:hypothetical protein
MQEKQQDLKKPINSRKEVQAEKEDINANTTWYEFLCCYQRKSTKESNDLDYTKVNSEIVEF